MVWDQDSVLEWGTRPWQGVATSPESGYEDLTTYTKVDPAGAFTVDASSVLATAIDADWDSAYLYYDFGADYFKANVVIEFEAIVTALTQTVRSFGLLALTNALGALEAAQGPVCQVEAVVSADDGWQFYAGHSNYATSYRKLAKLGIATYYCKFQTIDHTVGANDGQIILTVYDDAARTNIIGGGTIPRTDIPEAKIVPYRYLLVCQTYRDGSTHETVGTYKVQNIKIISNTA